jgi:2'-5' RNA ligase
MAAYHSIWLMPSGEDAALFDAVVDRLAARFGTEPFIPHLTLVEDMPRTAADLAAVLDAGFAGVSGFGAAIVGVDGGPSFFRSLYAAFRPEGPLLDLKRVAVERFGTGDVASFMPHVSLAYGAPEEAKATVATELARGLVGRAVRFDEIVVAASAQSIPIRDWSIVHRHRLS